MISTARCAKTFTRYEASGHLTPNRIGCSRATPGTGAASPPVALSLNSVGAQKATTGNNHPPPSAESSRCPPAVPQVLKSQSLVISCPLLSWCPKGAIRPDVTFALLVSIAGLVALCGLAAALVQKRARAPADHSTQQPVIASGSQGPRSTNEPSSSSEYSTIDLNSPIRPSCRGAQGHPH